MSHWSTLTCLNENDEQSDFVRTKNEVKPLSKFVFNDSEYDTTPLRVKPELLVNRKELNALSDASNLKIEIYCRRNLRNNFRYYTLNEELPVLSLCSGCEKLFPGSLNSTAELNKIDYRVSDSIIENILRFCITYKSAPQDGTTYPD